MLGGRADRFGCGTGIGATGTRRTLRDDDHAGFGGVCREMALRTIAEAVSAVASMSAAQYLARGRSKLM
jgi:hypothetical protein